ncbi:MAG: sigma-70 family RNA polymerase sigma factor [Rhodothermales bacterium]
MLVAHRDAPDVLMEQVLPVLYDEMHRLAHRHRKSHSTFDTTALVHEAYLRLVDQTRIEVRDRGHFLALASRAMRFVLIDYARRRNADKRGGGAVHQTLDRTQIAIDEQAADLLALNEALERLGMRSERLARVVECRYFGGLSVEETADALQTSTRTVKRDWQKARLWLHRELTEPA